MEEDGCAEQDGEEQSTSSHSHEVVGSGVVQCEVCLNVRGELFAQTKSEVQK